MKRRRTARRCFNLIEVAAATALLGLVMAGVYAGVHLNERMRRHYFMEFLAVKVLDNVAERATAAPALTEAGARAWLDDEFGQSELSGNGQLAAVCRRDGGQLVLAIRKTNGAERELASLRMNLHAN